MFGPRETGARCDILACIRPSYICGDGAALDNQTQPKRNNLRINEKKREQMTKHECFSPLMKCLKILILIRLDIFSDSF